MQTELPELQQEIGYAGIGDAAIIFSIPQLIEALLLKEKHEHTHDDG